MDDIPKKLNAHNSKFSESTEVASSELTDIQLVESCSSSNELAEETEDSKSFITVRLDDLRAHPEVEKKMEILPHEESIEALNHQFTEKNGANVAPIQVVEKPDGGYWVIDGMVRLNAAKSAGIEAIPVQLIKGISEDEIIFHIAKVQCLRRQNSDPVCLYFVKSLTDLAARRGKENQGQRNDLTSGRNRLEVGGNKFISQITGIGETKIKQAKKVLKNSELTKNVLSGGLTINGAFKEIKKAEKKDEQSAKSNSKARVTKLRTAVKEMSEGEIWEGLEGLSEDKLRFLQSKLEERLVAKND